MKVANFFRGKKTYIIELTRWAKTLGANEMIIHDNGSVTLLCEGGCICDRYSPTAKELRCKPLSSYLEPEYPVAFTEEEIAEVLTA